MKWFKHYADMHEGRSINNLLDVMGHTGLCFFLLQELCAEKLNPSSENLEETGTTFQFHPRVVRQKLRISPANLGRLLGVCAANGLLSFELSEKTLQIKMPILLELLDRDAKNARKTRVNTAEKTRLDLDLDLDLDKDKELTIDVAKAPRVIFELEKIYELYPRKVGKKSGLKKLQSQIKTKEDFDKLDQAVKNIAKYHKSKRTESQFIPHFATWVSSWEDSLHGEYAGQKQKIILQNQEQPVVMQKRQIEEYDYSEGPVFDGLGKLYEKYGVSSVADLQIAMQKESIK